MHTAPASVFFSTGAVARLSEHSANLIPRNGNVTVFIMLTGALPPHCNGLTAGDNTALHPVLVRLNGISEPCAADDPKSLPTDAAGPVLAALQAHATNPTFRRRQPALIEDYRTSLIG